MNTVNELKLLGLTIDRALSLKAHVKIKFTLRLLLLEEFVNLYRLQGFRNYVRIRNHIICIIPKKCIMVQNFDKSINKPCFSFHTLRDAWKFFFRKYGTFSQQIATAPLQK